MQPRRVVRFAVLAFLGLLLVAFLRVPILRGLGGLLVAEDPLTPADVIVLTIDVGAAGVLEAADLVHAGVGTRVAVFADPPDSVDEEFLRRGVAYENHAVLSVGELRALGVTNVEVIPRAAAGSEAEGEVLPSWCDSRHFHSVMVVATPDHCRRLRRIMHRSMQGHATTVVVRGTHYSVFQANRWWQTRDGARVGIIELQKLLLDFLKHPIS